MQIDQKNTWANVQTTFRSRFSGIIGNLLEHYDSALFGLLAPFIAPLFFEKQDPLTALILTYGMLPLGFLTRPLGSLFFGWIGDSFGRRQALFFSLFGMALVTIGIGCLPVYQDIGIWAPLLLALGRMLQSFCAAGESAGGAIFVLEHTAVSKRGFVSSCYDASSIGGILLASGLVTFMSAQGIIDQGWRILFWFGGITAIFGIFLRWKTTDGAEFVNAPVTKNVSNLQSLKEYKLPLLSIILASGFSHTTYSLAFTLMNGYIPLITSLSKTEVMQVNTILLVVDLFLLPCFGYLASKFGKEKVMLAGALCSALSAIPLFSLLNHASLATVIAVRLVIILFGVAFAAPYYAWAIEEVPARHRYLILSLGSALGSQLIGTPTSAICLWLYKTLGWSGAPALYLLAAGSAAGFVVYRSIKKKREEPWIQKT
jgi:MHS family proline/betaine transporter-like MFS transporter